MNGKHYEAWKQSRQIETGDVDIADAVMERISLKVRRQSHFKRPLNLLLLNFIQAKAFVRICVLASGAVAGLLRMMFAAYYALFT
ncbi:MAG: hypothetical protein ACYS8Z_13950 [Planctomycetota bacterium]|jgi:hypothetical protein